MSRAGAADPEALAPWREGGLDHIRVRATPSAKGDRIAAERDADGPFLRVWVTAAPADGAANAAIIALLAKALGRPKSRLSLVRGAAGRDKLIRLD